ncbi:hypothetical protein H320_07370 [Vibrio parahaemolyticus 49]|nr:hypothetical protein H320_07370 [Vibrio parahaemolyticus 49]
MKQDYLQLASKSAFSINSKSFSLNLMLALKNSKPRKQNLANIANRY